MGDLGRRNLLLGSGWARLRGRKAHLGKLGGRGGRLGTRGCGAAAGRRVEVFDGQVPPLRAEAL